MNNKKGTCVLYIEIQDDIGTYDVYYRSGDTFTTDVSLASRMEISIAQKLQAKIFISCNITMHIKEVQNV